MASPSVCRVCLSDNLDLYRVSKPLLAKYYKQLSGLQLKRRKFPETLCYVCLKELRKCGRFIETARRSNKALESWVRDKNELKCLARPLYKYTTSITEYVSFTSQETPIKQEIEINNSLSINVDENNDIHRSGNEDDHTDASVVKNESGNRNYNEIESSSFRLKLPQPIDEIENVLNDGDSNGTGINEIESSENGVKDIESTENIISDVESNKTVNVNIDASEIRSKIKKEVVRIDDPDRRSILCFVYESDLDDCDNPVSSINDNDEAEDDNTALSDDESVHPALVPKEVPADNIVREFCDQSDNLVAKTNKNDYINDLSHQFDNVASNDEQNYNNNIEAIRKLMTNRQLIVKLTKLPLEKYIKDPKNVPILRNDEIHEDGISENVELHNNEDVVDDNGEFHNNDDAIVEDDGFCDTKDVIVENDDSHKSTDALIENDEFNNIKDAGGDNGEFNNTEDIIEDDEFYNTEDVVSENHEFHNTEVAIIENDEFNDSEDPIIELKGENCKDPLDDARTEDINHVNNSSGDISVLNRPSRKDDPTKSTENNDPAKCERNSQEIFATKEVTKSTINNVSVKRKSPASLSNDEVPAKSAKKDVPISPKLNSEVLTSKKEVPSKSAKKKNRATRNSKEALAKKEVPKLSKKEVHVKSAKKDNPATQNSIEGVPAKLTKKDVPVKVKKKKQNTKVTKGTWIDVNKPLPTTEEKPDGSNKPNKEPNETTEPPLARLTVQEISCDLIGSDNTKQYRVSLQGKNTKELFSCNFCNYKSSYIKDLVHHILRKHTDDKPFACTECSYKGVSEDYLKRHMQTHSSERPFACTECNYRAKKKSYLSLHLKIHTGEKPFSCDICDYRCAFKGMLQKHLMTHTDLKPFSCDICGHKCRTNFDLLKHREVHSDEKRFSCDICDYKCKRKEHLKSHLIKHSGLKPYICEICGYRCAVKWNLRWHMKSHHSEDRVQKPFVCDICGFKCKKKGTLKIHMTRHTDIKPFVCNLCDYKTRLKQVLTRHMLTHTGEKPLSCNWCDFRCIQKTHLQKHIKNTHLK